MGRPCGGSGKNFYMVFGNVEEEKIDLVSTTSPVEARMKRVILI
jgi:hypothetical protein